MGQRDRPTELEGNIDEEDELLDGARRDRYMSLSARANFLAQDRQDLLFPAKELMRQMSSPSANDELKLKRVARYLKGIPRMVMEYRWGKVPDEITIYVDGDFAACRRTRKSTSGGVAMWGTGVLKAWSKTQLVLALSTGESELAAVVRGAAEGIGLRSCLADFGVHVQVLIRSDATAAMGIVKREGLGRVRHLAVADLWVQQRYKRGDIQLHKWPGPANPADLMTKGLDGSAITRHCTFMDTRSWRGRPALAVLR